MKRYALFTLSVLVLLFSVGLVGAQEIDPCIPCPTDTICTMECVPPITVGGVFTDPSWLKVDHHRVSVDIENQIATTNVDLEFVNEGNGLAEGTFIFPLPMGAAVDQLIMYINGVPIEARILPADEARQIYDEIVRQYRDPALLEYIGSQAIQANVFPIPPGESRRIEISYTQALEVDNGLIHYLYPFDVTSLVSSRRVDNASVSVTVNGSDEISNIYSPSHDIAISREGDEGFRVGFEESSYAPTEDFSLYWGIASDEINVNLLTYRESASDDGFFMLMVQPPLELPEDRIQPRDIIVVLDQSGSMDGEKWEQAQDAAAYILENLNPRDRFNVVLFSTGWRVFSNDLEDADEAGEAVDWIYNMFAEGGTDINGSLMTAMDMADPERDTTVLFITDGLATEGEVETDAILDNIENAAPSNARIFTFGVGDDVDTILLDTLAANFHGTSSYVRPNERIEEEVASLFNKISAPVLTDIDIDFGDDITVDTIYPAQPLPDLFAGTQLTIVGRYRGAAEDIDVTLSGEINGENETFEYDGLEFRERAGGEPFVARLWATRRIGDLLNSIRLNGEDPELVDSIITLSVRYGIITPYTSFLIEEDDILSQTGRANAQSEMEAQSRDLAASVSGADAVEAAEQFGNFADANAPMSAPLVVQPTMGGSGVAEGGEMRMDGDAGTMLYDDEVGQSPLQTVSDKTFILQNGVWTDTTFAPDTMETQKVVFLSDAYFALLELHPDMGAFLALGEHVIVVVDGVAYEVVSE